MSVVHRLQVEGGPEGEALAYAKEVLVLSLPKAFPPGMPMKVTCFVQDAVLVLRGKSIGSKRAPEGTYSVRLRLVGLRREARLVLEKSFREGPEGPT